MMRLAEAIASGTFSIVVELIASGVKREAQLLEVASDLANIAEVAAGSIASFPDGKVGQDPLRVGTAVRARGLPPNIHLTCANRDRVAIRQTLREMRALALFDVFAMTGDRPAAAAAASPEFDSIQLIEMIAQLRATEGTPFNIAVSVPPFGYTRESCLECYQRLERKVAAGANLAVTPPTWDARKLAELKRWSDDRGLAIPLFGNVHVLTRRAAEQMGAAVPPALVDVLRKESDAADGGLQTRLERAARTLAVVKGLGYAGAYIGGTQSAEQVSEILHRAREFEAQWSRCADELQFGAPDGFYLDAATSAATGSAGARTAQSAPIQS